VSQHHIIKTQQGAENSRGGGQTWAHWNVGLSWHASPVTGLGSRRHDRQHQHGSASQMLARPSVKFGFTVSNALQLLVRQVNIIDFPLALRHLLDERSLLPPAA
jgi:hypothetical protein